MGSVGLRGTTALRAFERAILSVKLTGPGAPPIISTGIISSGIPN